MNETESRPAVAGQVEPSVRPVAWASPVCLRFLASASALGRTQTWLRNTPEEGDVRLYDQAALDAAVAAERERWRAACEEIAHDLRNHDMVRLGAAKCIDRALKAQRRGHRPDTAVTLQADATEDPPWRVRCTA